MKKLITVSISVVIFVAASLAPLYAGWNPLKTEKAEDQKVKNTKVAEAIANFKNNDPSMKVFFEKAYGYAVFPTVAKGGFGIGGAYGEGEVFEKGKLIGAITRFDILRAIEANRALVP